MSGPSGDRPNAAGDYAAPHTGQARFKMLQLRTVARPTSLRALATRRASIVLSRTCRSPDAEAHFALIMGLLYTQSEEQLACVWEVLWITGLLAVLNARPRSSKTPAAFRHSDSKKSWEFPACQSLHRAMPALECREPAFQLPQLGHVL